MIAVITFALSCLVLYFNSLWNTFVFDDLHTIVQNLYIKEVRYWPLFFKGFYSSEPIPKGMLRPFLLLTFSFSYFFSKLQPLGYHIINILIHFLNGVLFYSLLRFLKKEFSFGYTLFFTLLFISHPLNTEPLNYISCRSDLLVTFLILSAVLYFLKEKYLPSLCVYVLALLTKETALIFLFLVLGYDFLRPLASDYTPAYRQAGISKKITQIRYKYIFYITLIGISISYWVYRGIIFSSGASILAPLSSSLLSFWSNILLQSIISLFYLRLFLWPHPLSIHHVFSKTYTLSNPVAFFSLFAIIAMIICAFTLRKKQPLISLGLCWYLIGLLPKFYALLHFPAMEHHFYLPSVGIYIILASILLPFYSKFRRQFIYASAGFIGVFTILVWFRNYEWRDSFSLWKVTVKYSPYSATAHNNLGIEYGRKELNAEAEEEFHKALSLTTSKDVHLMARQNLAELYSAQGKFQEALEQINMAIAIQPDYYYVYYILGHIYFKQLNNQEAERAWLKGLTINSLSADLQASLGMLYLQENRLKDAKDYFQAAIRSDPDVYLSYFGLGQVLQQESDIDGAIKFYRKSLILNPTYALSHYALGNAYALKRDPRALWHLKEAIKLKPDFASAHNDLAVLYVSIEPPQLELSRRHAKKAIALGYKVEEGFLKIIDLPQSQGLHETK